MSTQEQKLVGDYPYIGGDLSATPPSGRNELDNYGKRVAVTDDLMVVSSPAIQVPDPEDVPISGAGSLFVYRRATDLAGEKAAWSMEDKLMLPSGFRRDYVSKVVENLPSLTSLQSLDKNGILAKKEEN